MEKWLYCAIKAIYIMYHIYLYITSFITFAEVEMHREGYYKCYCIHENTTLQNVKIDGGESSVY